METPSSRDHFKRFYLNLNILASELAEPDAQLSSSPEMHESTPEAPRPGEGRDDASSGKGASSGCRSGSPPRREQ